MSEVTQLAPVSSGALMDITPRTLTEAKELATLMSESSLVPKDYQRAPHNILVAMMMGAEVGLRPMQAIQNIAVINGRPSVWGDAALAIVKAQPSCEDVVETMEGEGDARVARCEVRRRGRQPVVRTFSVEEAKSAGLWAKTGPWQNYPARMLQMRARGFALRDAFPDALRGMYIAEEAQDIPVEREVSGAHRSVGAAPKGDDALKAALGRTADAAEQALEERADEIAADLGSEPEALRSEQQPLDDHSPNFEDLAARMFDAESMDDVRAVMKDASKDNDLKQDERAYLADQANKKRLEFKGDSER